MPGSEYYDRDPTPQEIEFKIREDRARKEKWEATLNQLYLLKSGVYNNRFDAKLEDLRDFVRARIQEIKV